MTTTSYGETPGIVDVESEAVETEAEAETETESESCMTDSTGSLDEFVVPDSDVTDQEESASSFDSPSETSSNASTLIGGEGLPAVSDRLWQGCCRHCCLQIMTDRDIDPSGVQAPCIGGLLPVVTEILRCMRRLRKAIRAQTAARQHTHCRRRTRDTFRPPSLRRSDGSTSEYNIGAEVGHVMERDITEVDNDSEQPRSRPKPDEPVDGQHE